MICEPSFLLVVRSFKDAFLLRTCVRTCVRTSALRTIVPADGAHSESTFSVRTTLRTSALRTNNLAPDRPVTPGLNPLKNQKLKFYISRV
ncbi:TPA: hypothetical protein MIQ63_001427 [Klebsiella aerogenes]|nr:hypothetical protein [Klebsiella aerogenes]